MKNKNSKKLLYKEKKTYDLNFTLTKFECVPNTFGNVYFKPIIIKSTAVNYFTNLIGWFGRLVCLWKFHKHRDMISIKIQNEYIRFAFFFVLKFQPKPMEFMELNGSNWSLRKNSDWRRFNKTLLKTSEDLALQGTNTYLSLTFFCVDTIKTNFKAEC